MDVVSVLERTVEVQVEGLATAAPLPLALMVDHLMTLADRRSGAHEDHGHPEVSSTASSDLAHDEAAMAVGLSAFEAAERLRGLVDAAQLGALTRLHSSAQAVFDSAAALSWVGRTPITAHEMVVLEVTAATGLGPAASSRPRGSSATRPRTRWSVRPWLPPVTGQDCPTRSSRSGCEGRSSRSTPSAKRPVRRPAGASVPTPRSSTTAPGTLTITNDAEKIAAAIDRADRAARAARAQGEPRTLDQLRADFLTDAAIFGWPDGRGSFGAVRRQPAGSVPVVMPFSTLFGYDDAPCELPGHGWVSARHAREIATAEESTWQALLADVDTGRALALSRKGYRPTSEMIEHVRALTPSAAGLDATCRPFATPTTRSSGAPQPADATSPFRTTGSRASGRLRRPPTTPHRLRRHR